MSTDIRPQNKHWSLAVLVAFAAGFLMHGLSDKPGQVTVLRGTTRLVAGDQTAIFFEGSRVGGPRLRIFKEDSGFDIAGAQWFDGQSWHTNGVPACLEPGDRRQKIEMGLLEADANDDGPGRAVVVWLKCLEPTS